MYIIAQHSYQGKVENLTYMGVSGTQMAMNTCQLSLDGLAETQRLGTIIGANLLPSDVLYLNGDLGAGKTTFTKSLAEALGIAPEAVTSPTFTLVHEYQGRTLRLFHFDIYRLKGTDDLEQLGFDDYALQSDAVIVVEWANRAASGLPLDALTIELTIGSGQEDHRTVTLSAGGKRSTELLETITESFIDNTCL